MATVALIACLIGIATLFLLDRDRSIRNSKALWLPVVWFWITGSRPISAWIARRDPLTFAPGELLDAALEGNSTDAAIFSVLLAIGLIVLFRRRRQASALLRANYVVVIYFSYCLLSVLWSPFPGVAFKRWIKAASELVMVLIILTDGHPIVALRRLFSRVGFILLPASVFLIRYSDLGRGYDPDGKPMNTGVTTNKNTLGLVVFVVGLGVLWNVLTLVRAKGLPNRGRQLLAQSALLGFVIALLVTAHSATAVACFVLGSGLILVTGLSTIRRRPAAVHAVVLLVAIAGGAIALFGGSAVFVGALGRDTNLTGRTDIWKAVIPMAVNPIVGAGFESFWNASSKTLRTFTEVYQFGNLNSAHNGYIDVYLNLGWVGVCLIALILFSGYRHACAAFRYQPELGSLILAYVATALFYSITEAGFRLLNPMWFCLLLAVVAANSLSSAQVAQKASWAPATPAKLAARSSMSSALTFGRQRRIN